LAFDLWEPPDAVAGMDAIAVATRDRAPDEAQFLAKLRRSFDSVELAEEIDVRSLGVLVQRMTVWTCRDYRPSRQEPASAAPAPVIGSLP
jgi:hypothetical protein